MTDEDFKVTVITILNETKKNRFVMNEKARKIETKKKSRERGILELKIQCLK